MKTEGVNCWLQDAGYGLQSGDVGCFTEALSIFGI